MGTSNSTDIKKTFGVDVNKQLDAKTEIEVTRQMAGFTTPRRIVKGMQFFGDNVKVQRAGAKQLSNLAFNVENVGSVLHSNGLNRLMKALKLHMDDWKLCWFGASAIWNMARPAEARLRVGVSVETLIEMLRIHQHREQVAHTCLGALSNLALEERNADRMIGDGSGFFELVFDTLKKHNGNRSVMTSSLGLLANLAIRENVAAELAEFGAVQWIIKGLKLFLDQNGKTLTQNESETRLMLIENGMAALSNITFVETFPKYFLKAQGLEVLCDILRCDEELPLSEEEDIPLLNNILESVGVSLEAARDKDCQLYSFHQAVKMNFSEETVICSLLKRKGVENQINIVDGAGMTPLRYAVFNKDKPAAELLVTSGAVVSKSILAEADEQMANFLTKWSKTYQSMLYSTQKSITSSSDLNGDLSGLVMGFLSKYELRNTFGGNPQWA